MFTAHPVDMHMLGTLQVFEGPHGPQHPAMAQLLSQMIMLVMQHRQWVLLVADHLDIDGICIHREPYSIANTTLWSNRMSYWQVEMCLFVSNSWSHRTENPRSEQVRLLYYLRCVLDSKVELYLPLCEWEWVDHARQSWGNLCTG